VYQNYRKEGRPMKRKTKLLCDHLVRALSSWPTVECICLNEAAQPDVLDPYFALILDVYYRDQVPPPAERQGLYGSQVAAFETSAQQNKDRFILNSLPVRIEFKNKNKIEELVDIATAHPENLWLIKDSGTYGFYRLTHGEVLFERTPWIESLRSRLTSLSEPFWREMRESYQSKMEHFLSDLGAALLQNDDFYYLISAAGFIRSACAVLFCINHRFEPSHKYYYEEVLKLPVLPAEFAGRFESFLRNEPSITPERRYSVAQLIARSIIALP